MLKRAADLDSLFPDRSIEEQCAAATEAGFDGVSVATPYEGDAQALRDQLVVHGLSLVAMSTPPPNYTGGLQGWAAVPECKARFKSDWRRVSRYAGVLKPAHIRIGCGAATGPEAEDCLIDNLGWLCSTAPTQSFTRLM